MERALDKLVFSSAGGTVVGMKGGEVKEKTKGGLFSEPISIPGEPFRAEETSLLPNRPEPQVPGIKLNPKDL
jgi:hypothetical protein